MKPSVRRDSRPGSWSGLVLVASLLVGCSGRAAPVRTPEPEARAVPAVVPSAPLELTLDQLALRERLVGHTRQLAERIGERNLGKHWELADAADYLVREWEKMGLVVEYAGYSVDGRPLSNLGVRFEGTDRKDEVVLVLAPYDSSCGSPGPSAAATTAVLLELARSLSATRFRRTVQLWALATSECVDEETARGSAALFRPPPPESSLIPRREGKSTEKVALAIDLRHLGRLAAHAADATQRRVDLRGLPSASAEAELLRENLDGEGLVASVEALSGSPTGEPAFADLERLASGGVPAVLVVGREDEGPIEPDFLAVLAWRLAFAVGRVSLEELTNDGMLTPDLARVR